MSIGDSFRRRVEDYIDSSGMTASDFGRLAVGDTGFVLELRRGRSPRLSTVDRVLAWIDTNPVLHEVSR
jgi:predicted transcriptional regulator